MFPRPEALLATARKMPMGSMPPMGVKAPILNRDKGFRHIKRQIAKPDRRPAGIAAIGEHGAIVAEDRDIGRAPGDGELVNRR